MVATSSLYGGVAPTSILPSDGTGGTIQTTFVVGASEMGKKSLSGSLTANTYKEMVSLSSSGWIRLCGVYCVDGTSRTLGLKIVIDGTTVFDEVSSAITTANAGIMGVGHASLSSSNYSQSSLEMFRFNSSLSISIKSSITETDKIVLLYLTAV